jgi:hypothetical protein
MGNIAGDPIWEDNIYQFEETDVVDGGPDGIDNVPLGQLANRTQFLKNATGSFDDITLVTATKVLTKSDIFHKLVAIHANTASIACTLPVLNNSTDKGTRANIMAYAVAKQVSIISAANNIVFAAGTRGTIYLGEMESLQLFWTGTQWFIIAFTGNLLDVGRFEWGYSLLPNTLIANGQVVNRADYPRLWQYIQTVAGSLFDDFTWANSPGFKGFFSSGNGSTTFRLPDLRSMFIRGLDFGAGIDFARNNSNPGGYEADAFKSHSHNYNPGDQPGRSDNANDRDVMLPGGQIRATDAVGDLETRPKNIGLLPLIKI